MATRDVKVGEPIWIDIMTSDPDTTRKFYSALFGWDSTDPDPTMGGYFNFFRDGEFTAGGMSKADDNPMPDMWSVYLKSDDATKTVETAAANGATVIVPAMDVTELGTMGVFIDPAGNGIGVWQPKEHKGFAVRGEPNSPAWIELMTKGYDAELQFYRDVFGWETLAVHDTPEFRYSFSDPEEAHAAGVMDASNEHVDVPLGWAIYFGSENVDATVATALELGASIVQPAVDTPYGRLAALTDSTGALFKLRG
jgi:predicted enzyme related to lactoylglutathione lyase